MKSTGRWLAMAALIIGSVAQAQDCREQLPQILVAAYGAEPQVDLEMAACKVWPARPELTLIAYSSPGDEPRLADLQLLVVTTNGSRLVARHLEPGALDSDAIYVAEIAIDTAPYKLRQDRLAFGVRVSRRNDSSMNPFTEQSLNLYVLESEVLRPVLGDLVVERSLGEWDGSCQGTWGGSSSTLAIAEQAGSAGYHDLLLHERSSQSRQEARGEQCATVEEQKDQQRHRLSYDGERYVVPQQLQRVR